ncbi:MAG: hypothetical protein JWO78_1718 [Micavibrio sp.]|nr:hypothetical protein [Micavibrio sp.]
MAQSGLSESEFSMWRTVFAFATVDGVLSLEEQQLLQSYRHKVTFSMTQLEILRQDMTTPRDVVAMYKKITQPEHKKRFCILARALSWCEGDMDRQEQAILKQLDCFKSGADADILRSTRGHPHVHDYYQEYARAGIMGLRKSAPAVQIRT